MVCVMVCVCVCLCVCVRAQQLATLFGEYVEGLTEDSLRLDIGLSSGAATLTNLRIKPGVRQSVACRGGRLVVA